MKKIMCIFALSVMTVACSDRNELVSVEQLNSVQSTDSNYAKKPRFGAMASFDFVLGRRSKDCEGWGICGLAAFGFTIVELPPPPAENYNRGVIVLSEDGSYHAEYYLTEPLTLTDTTFYVDEDLSGSDEEDNNYVIKAGSYNLETGMGTYGGYKIDVIKL